MGNSRLSIKADIHLHTAEDPCDIVEYSSGELLEMAHREGFRAIAITLHKRVLVSPELTELATKLDITLIPGAELRIEGSDVIVLNISPDEAAAIQDFTALERLRESRGSDVFIMAPHPYYVLGGSMGSRLEKYIHLFDAIEYCHLHTRWFDPNSRARKIAERHQIPMVATSDAHRRWAFGRFYSKLAVPDNFSMRDIFDAIRGDRIEMVSPPHSLSQFIGALFYILVDHPLRGLLYRNDRRFRQNPVNDAGSIARGR